MTVNSGWIEVSAQLGSCCLQNKSKTNQNKQKSKKKKQQILSGSFLLILDTSQICEFHPMLCKQIPPTPEQTWDSNMITNWLWASTDVCSLCGSSDEIIVEIRLFWRGKTPQSLGPLPESAATNLFGATSGWWQMLRQLLWCRYIGLLYSIRWFHS